MKFTSKVVLIHCEVMACKDVAVVAGINTVGIFASRGGEAVLNDLLVACDVRADKFEVLFSLAVACLAYMRSVCVSKRVCLPMEYCSQRGLRPRQIWIVICVYVTPNPIFFAHRQVVLQCLVRLAEGKRKVISASIFSFVEVMMPNAKAIKLACSLIFLDIEN